MTIARTTLACTLLLAIATTASAFESDEAAWIRRCVTDNANAGRSAETLAVYCGCMNDKMPNEETLSISAWEKTHRTEQEACSALAKWRSPGGPETPVPQDNPSGSRRTIAGAQP